MRYQYIFISYRRKLDFLAFTSIYALSTVAHKCHRKTLSHGNTFFLAAKLSCSKPFFVTAKLSLSRQNFPSHGKLFFLAAKFSFSRQNLFSHGKTFFLTAKLSFLRQLFLLLQSKFTNSQSEGERVIKIADYEDKADDFIRKYFYREICLFLQRNHECIFRITTLKGKSNNMVCIGECHVMTSML